MADYTKFKAYWESIGKPPVEYKKTQSSEFMDLYILNPEFDCINIHSYRIKDDPHWELRKKWVDSDFTLPIESKSENIGWGTCPKPLWYPNHQYREMEQKQMTEKQKQYRQRCGRPGGIYEWNANPGSEYKHNGWHVDDSGIKHPCSFDNNLKFHANKEDPRDLIEVTPYDGIAIDTPGYAVGVYGNKHKRHFAGVNIEYKPIVWRGGGTSWTEVETVPYEDFIPKGNDE